MKKKIHNFATAIMLFISAALLPILIAQDAYADLGAPTNLSVVVGENGVQLTWEVGDNASAVERYAVFWSNDNWANGRAVSSQQTSIFLAWSVLDDAGLLGQGFQFKIRADNDTLRSYSTWSQEVNVFIPVEPMVMPVFPPKSVMATVNENEMLSLSAPEGMIFTQVLFASYGTPNNFTIGECHATDSVAIVQAAINNNLLSISADNGVFGDPCGGTYKRLSVVLAYDLAPSPQPTETATPVASPSPSPSATPETTPVPSPTPSPQQSESPSPAPVEPSPTPTASPVATPSNSPTPTPQPEPSPTPQPSPSPTPVPEPPAPQPEPPVIRPEPPVVVPEPTPEPPVVEEPPAIEPEPPIVEPEPPAVEPEPPVVESEPPVVKPEPPVVEPEPPLIEPEPPIAEKEPPAVEPKPLPIEDKPLPNDEPLTAETWKPAVAPEEYLNKEEIKTYEEIGLVPNSTDQLPTDVPKLPEPEQLKPRVQQDVAGVENGGIEFFGTQSQPQVIGEDGQLTPPPPPPGSGLPIPPDAVTTTETFIGQAGGVTFNSPDIAVPVEPIELNIEIPGVGEAAQALANTYVAMANVGNDMSPITRKKAKKILIATLVVGQIATLRRM
jgi:hypothetical protein